MSAPEDPATGRRCLWCGRPLAEQGRGRRRLYCGQACRQRAYEHRQGVGLRPGSLRSDQAGSGIADQAFQLRCAAEDVATAVAEGADRGALTVLIDDVLVLARAIERSAQQQTGPQ